LDKNYYLSKFGYECMLKAVDFASNYDGNTVKEMRKVQNNV